MREREIYIYIDLFNHIYHIIIYILPTDLLKFRFFCSVGLPEGTKSQSGNEKHSRTGFPRIMIPIKIHWAYSRTSHQATIIYQVNIPLYHWYPSMSIVKPCQTTWKNPMNLIFFWTRIIQHQPTGSSTSPGPRTEMRFSMATTTPGRGRWRKQWSFRSYQYIRCMIWVDMGYEWIWYVICCVSIWS